MPEFNQFLQMGRLVADPEFRYTATGTPVADFRVATTTQYGKESHQQDKVFMKWAVFGKRAERLCEYFRKGDPIFVKGRIKTNTWDGPNGEKRSQNEGIVDEWQFVGNTQGGQQRTQQADPQPPPPPTIPGAQDAIGDSDIPF